MGTFDYFTFHADVPGLGGTTLQTKYLKCELKHFGVDARGQLYSSNLWDEKEEEVPSVPGDDFFTAENLSTDSFEISLDGVQYIFVSGVCCSVSQGTLADLFPKASSGLRRIWRYFAWRYERGGKVLGRSPVDEP